MVELSAKQLVEKYNISDWLSDNAQWSLYCYVVSTFLTLTLLLVSLAILSLSVGFA